MKPQSSESGFSLLELMITVSIMGILAASVTYGVSDYIKEKRSEQHIIGLWCELSSLRARAIRDDRFYFVQFTDAGNGVVEYSLYRDVNSNNLLDIGTDEVMNSGFMGVSGDITFGLADGIDLSKKVQKITPVAAGLTGDWKTNNTITFENDEIGSISDGAIFLKNTSLKNRGYAIIKASNSHTVKLWKWDGSKWYEM